MLITAILCIAIIIYDMAFGYSDDLLEKYEGENITFCGDVCKVSFKDEEYYQIVLKNVKAGKENTPYDKKVLVNIYSDVKDYLDLMGQNVKVNGEISIPKERSNPGCFDYRKYLKSIDIRVVVTASSITQTDDKGLMRHIFSVRTKAIKSINENIGGDEAGILIGMIFGDTDYISDDTMDMFRKGGTAHILAVSGLHIGIIYSFLLKFRRRKRSRPADISVCIFLLGYSALCVFSPSVMRAVLMIYIHILAEHLNRRYDFTCCICASMIILLCINPWQLFNTGFQMSFLAAFTIAVILPVLKDKISGIMLSIVTIQIGMMPFTAYIFNYISLSSFICNIPIAYLSSVMIPIGVVFLPLCLFGIEGPFTVVMKALAKLLISLNEFTYADGLFNFDCISPPLWILVFVYAAGFFLCSEKGRILISRKDRASLKRYISAILALSLTVCFFTADPFDKAEFTFVDVGQGDCLHIHDKGFNILIDGGGNVNYSVGEKTLKPYLLKNGVTHIDFALVTHLHTDHFQGICELSKCFKIDTLLVYEGNRADEEEIRLKCNVKNIVYLEKGDCFKVGKRGKIEILSPKAGIEVTDENENQTSLIAKVTIEDVSVLMTADIDEEGEKNLLQDSQKGKLECDILKIAHHGSKYSSCDEFLDAVNPDMAVISVGKNTYGHPDQMILEKLDEKNIATYRTDDNGAVGIDADKKRIFLMKEGKS